MKKEQTNPPSNKNPKNSTEKLPEDLKANYIKHACKGSSAIENLKVAAVLKLWHDRGYRDIKFDVPLAFDKKTVFVKVLAKKAEGLVVGVECASKLRVEWLRERLALLQACLPPDSYIIAVFPETIGEKTKKVVKLADEIWVTGKNGKVAQMMFSTVLHKE